MRSSRAPKTYCELSPDSPSSADASPPPTTTGGMSRLKKKRRASSSSPREVQVEVEEVCSARREDTVAGSKKEEKVDKVRMLVESPDGSGTVKELGKAETVPETDDEAGEESDVVADGSDVDLDEGGALEGDAPDGGALEEIETPPKASHAVKEADDIETPAPAPAANLRDDIQPAESVKTRKRSRPSKYAVADSDFSDDDDDDDDGGGGGGDSGSDFGVDSSEDDSDFEEPKKAVRRKASPAPKATPKAAPRTKAKAAPTAKPPPKTKAKVTPKKPAPKALARKPALMPKKSVGQSSSSAPKAGLRKPALAVRRPLTSSLNTARAPPAAPRGGGGAIVPAKRRAGLSSRVKVKPLHPRVEKNED